MQAELAEPTVAMAMTAEHEVDAGGGREAMARPETAPDWTPGPMTESQHALWVLVHIQLLARLLQAELAEPTVRWRWLPSTLATQAEPAETRAMQAELAEPTVAMGGVAGDADRRWRRAWRWPE